MIDDILEDGEAGVSLTQINGIVSEILEDGLGLAKLLDDALASNANDVIDVEVAEPDDALVVDVKPDTGVLEEGVDADINTVTGDAENAEVDLAVITDDVIVEDVINDVEGVDADLVADDIANVVEGDVEEVLIVDSQDVGTGELEGEYIDPVVGDKEEEFTFNYVEWDDGEQVAVLDNEIDVNEIDGALVPDAEVIESEVVNGDLDMAIVDVNDIEPIVPDINSVLEETKVDELDTTVGVIGT